jgi:hypothetical protein
MDNQSFLIGMAVVIVILLVLSKLGKLTIAWNTEHIGTKYAPGKIPSFNAWS